MKSKILLLVSVFFFSVTIPQAIAQGLTGRAYYKSSSQINISMDSTKMAPGQMAEIQAQLKKQMDRDYILSFTQTESNWKQAESLGGGPATASSGGMTMVINTGNQDKILYRNLADQSFLREE
jgi:GLPGLI family protein